MAVSWIHFATAYCGYLTVRPTLTKGGPPPLERNWLRYSVVTWSSFAICSGVQNFAVSTLGPYPGAVCFQLLLEPVETIYTWGVQTAKAR